MILRDGREISAPVLTLERGSVIRIVDMFPGEESPMHRTSSIDYGIVLEGEIELELDEGVTKTVGAGGIIIQRGNSSFMAQSEHRPYLSDRVRID